ncbi:MAG TPA: peptidoglycan-binding protein [Solirubrobacteraceae bacterium]|nr:peptidoglycan-binding protein [Solirubrobacteraceae bacterium]
MRAQPRRGRWTALAAIVVIVIVVLLIVVDPFHGSSKPSAGVADNATPTSITTVKRQTLSSQTQVDGTLGYAGSSKILVPSGNAPSALQQSEQQVASGEAQVASAQRTLESDSAALQRAQGQLAAARAKEAVDCAGEGAAEAGSSAAEAASSGGGAGTCAGDRQTVTSGEQGKAGAEAKVTADRAQLASAQTSLAHASSALATAHASAVTYAQGAVYTSLPSVGKVIDRNHSVYAIAGQPTILLYGQHVASRAFVAGMSAGPDVGELNANLEALGYGSGLAGDEFTAATAAAIRAFQAAHGLAQTGALALGSVVFEPGPVRVTSVTPTVGMGVTPGPALTVSSTRRQVTVKLDASEQASVKKGDRVVITLPNEQTTSGTVSYVASVAVAPPSQNGEESAPTIEVDITPSEPRATGHLDAAPVQVSITTASVPNALAVPVTALLALAGGGYAVEEVRSDGVHRLLPVTVGQFDDEAGLVQVSGPGLAAGQRVVVPQT